jgi:hypothetical protein
MKTDKITVARKTYQTPRLTKRDVLGQVTAVPSNPV